MFLQNAPDRCSIHNEDFCSIVITSFNRFDFLHNLIDSIHRYADMPFEIIVSDDGGYHYNNFDFIQSLKPKISHLALNLGKNKGLALSANNGVALSRSKNVFLFVEDIEISKPFMRTVSTALQTSYVGTVWLGAGIGSGRIFTKTSNGSKLGLFTSHGSSAGLAFRKEYWLEVEGYSEYDMYGDLPFVNKGWQKGYFSTAVDPGIFGFDKDQTENKSVKTSMNHNGQHLIDRCWKHYPKLFNLSEETQKVWSLDRQNQIGRLGDKLNKEPFNERIFTDWRNLVESATPIGLEPKWEMLEPRFGRFLNQIKEDYYRNLNEG